jgi:xanthine dehydrogenase YagT iron-sulfur-binding subunit
VEIRLRVNGRDHELDLEPRVSLLDALRERLAMTGTKKGCDQGACGACTVLVDGERVLSCLALAVQYRDREITTIEGVDHPLQAAFVRNDGLQCGYCTSGQICSAIGMLAEHQGGTPLSDEEIRERMSGNLCRCGAYNGIVAAIREVAS